MNPPFTTTASIATMNALLADTLRGDTARTLTAGRRVLVIGPGVLADAAEAQLAARDGIVTCRSHIPPNVDQIPTLVRACSPQAIVIETSCLASLSNAVVGALCALAPTVLPGTDEDAQRTMEGLRLGARGHVDWPEEAPERLDAAIDAVLTGYAALSPRLTSMITDELQKNAPIEPVALCPQQQRTDAPRVMRRRPAAGTPPEP